MIRPYTRRPAVHPVGVLRADGTVMLEDGKGRGSLDRVPAGVILYGHRETVLAARLVGARRGSVLRWNQTAYRYDVGTKRVHLLGTWGADDDATLEGLVAWRDYLASVGARMGSVRQSAASLLRASLDRPLVLDGGEAPPIRDVVGGRQTAVRPPGYFGPVELWDLTAAYASAMGAMTYGGRWYDVGDLEPDRLSDCPAICHATVYVPRDVVVGPLPRRARSPGPPAVRRFVGRDYPTAARLSGCWSFDELLAARRCGCTVTIDRTWIMPGERRPFAAWWDLVRVGRELPGFAGRLAKGAGNALWGTFIAGGDRTRLSFAGGDRRETDEPVAGTMPTAPALAELVNARVRTRLWSELLEPYRLSVISVHTDGGILEAGQSPDLPLGWRLKAQGDALTYLGPQAFAYRQGNETRYVVSGVPAADAPEVFRNLADLVLHRPMHKLPSPTDLAGLRMIREHFPELVDAR